MIWGYGGGGGDFSCILKSKKTFVKRKNDGIGILNPNYLVAIKSSEKKIKGKKLHLKRLNFVEMCFWETVSHIALQS